MKYLFPIFSLFIFIGCTTSPDAEKNTTASIERKRGPYQPKPNIPDDINYDFLDSTVRKQIRALDSIYGKTPYYTTLQNQKLFIVMKGDFDNNYYSQKFTGRFKYGIVGDSLKLILSCEYDKIYNPNLTMLNCMEIKKESKVGLFNFISGEILEPQFEYIAPSSQTSNHTAYGFKAGGWYKIENSGKMKVANASFLPIDLFETLSFNALNVNENLWYSSYDASYNGDGPIYGFGVVLTPSYLEHLHIMPEICEDLILPDQKEINFGTNEMRIKTDTVRTITDKIVAFVASFYQEGVDARGFIEDSRDVIVYNKEKMTFTTSGLNHKYDGYDNFCKTEGHRFVNDTLIEVLGRNQTDTSKKDRYDFENGYFYKVITKEGEIKNLHCNRYYNFTKYFEINESYFTGCFAKWINEEEKYSDSNNVWVSEHLTLDDLDLMVNEIYAEYGLKFKTSKWQTYFSQFSWYHPQYDNVDNKLTDIDKKNIELIAKEKVKMKGKENDYVKKHKSTYWAAG